MKREALRHPKMLDLAARLRIPREHAIGTMDVLLDWVHDMAPRGDVGKWPDGAIAVASGWTGNPDEFINALIDARWLDRHPVHRLLVHDYPDHAERFVKAKLAKSRQWFCFAYYTTGRKWDAPSGIHPPDDEMSILPSRTVEPTTVGTTGPPVEPTVPRDQTQPNQSKPNHPQTPTEVRPAAGLAGGWDLWTKEEEAKARQALSKCGLKRLDLVIGQCRDRGQTPDDVLHACEEYKVNKSKFTSPGAIVEFLRSGVWPVNGVLPIDMAKGNSKANLTDKQFQAIESARLKLMRSGVPEARNFTHEEVIAKTKELQTA